MPLGMSIVTGMDVSVPYDVAVVGGGPAGLSAAIALTEAGAKTVLIARRVAYADNRTTALLGASVDFLRELDVWRRCEDKAAALKTMRLVDDTGRLIRAPEVRFAADEIGREAFGYNVENRILMEALEARAAELPGLIRHDDDAESVTPTEEAVLIRTAGGKTLSAYLVVGADGRHSLCREAAGISVSSRDLHQAALTFNVGHTRPHGNISTEFHTPQGPCVFVPLPDHRCSVVWVTNPKEAERLRGLSDDELSDAAEKQSHSILGRMTVAGGRHVFPLVDRAAASVRAKTRGAGRRSRACAPADRRARPQHGTARCCRHCGCRARCDFLARRSRHAERASPLRRGTARRCVEPHVCHRSRQPLAAFRAVARAVTACGGPAFDRIGRSITASRDARRAGAVLARRPPFTVIFGFDQIAVITRGNAALLRQCIKRTGNRY